jgi:hypothetical protein
MTLRYFLIARGSRRLKFCNPALYQVHHFTSTVGVYQTLRGYLLRDCLRTTSALRARVQAIARGLANSSFAFAGLRSARGPALKIPPAAPSLRRRGRKSRSVGCFINDERIKFLVEVAGDDRISWRFMSRPVPWQP